MEYKISTKTSKFLEGIQLLDQAFDLIDQSLDNAEREEWYNSYCVTYGKAVELLKARIENSIGTKHFSEI